MESDERTEIFFTAFQSAEKSGRRLKIARGNSLASR